MALFRGIQEYIALDANNITLVFDSGNIVNIDISGNIFLYPPQGHPLLYNYFNTIPDNMASRIPEPVIGIDLGTSYSCVAVYYNGTLEVIPNDYGSRLTPSYVNFTENGRLFGDNALNQISRTPSNRLFGKYLVVSHVLCSVEPLL